MSDGRRVSVVLPVFNGARFLEAAVASVESQTASALEIIVVDDGSTDETPTLIAGFGDRIRASRQDNQGPSAARNAGIRSARGDLVAFIDADDLWAPRHLEHLLAALDAQPSVSVALGRVEVQSMEGEAQELPQPAEPRHCYHLGAALFRSAAFDSVGLLDPELSMSEDMDWFLRARESGVEMCRVDELVYIHRRHDSNATSSMTITREGMLSALRMSLKRRAARESLGPIPEWRKQP